MSDRCKSRVWLFRCRKDAEHEDRHLWWFGRALIGKTALYWPRKVDGVPVEANDCWCGLPHPATFWHDPTHGRIDRDIQQQVEEQFGPDLDKGQRTAIECTIQNRRNRELGRPLV